MGAGVAVGGGGALRRAIDNWLAMESGCVIKFGGRAVSVAGNRMLQFEEMASYARFAASEKSRSSTT